MNLLRKFGVPAMTRRRSFPLLVVLSLLLLAGCATRPVNPPIAQYDPNVGYRYTTRAAHRTLVDPENLVILAFSGGGTRAAAFSYGVLEALRRMEITGPKGRTIRMLDEVDIVSGVSGGSFTALAFGLYGDKLFDIYESSFLKRNVQGELIARALSPSGWGTLASQTAGRSELASQLYDEILFHGATFGDLDSGGGPFVNATATDISTGVRLGFNQGVFDVLCSNVNEVSLSRAAAASSAVPVVLSPVTINNYGGTCGFTLPRWLQPFTDAENPPRPAARTIKHLRDLQAYEDGANNPYIHLVDGGLADNLSMRGALEVIDGLEALHMMGLPTPFDRVRRIVVFVVNSRSAPDTHWNESESAPGTMEMLIKATGVPIDHYSYEAVELLRDTVARWQAMRQIRESGALTGIANPAIARLVDAPNIELYAIDVSFPAIKDKAEFDYLNNLPTSFVLPPEAVDRLRAAAQTIILSSPEIKRLIKDAGATMVVKPAAAASPAVAR
jgi:NTE family protein